MFKSFSPPRIQWFAAAILGMAIAHAPALAGNAFPTEPIRIIVPYPAGGGTDTLARLLGPHLSERLKTPVVVDNKPGASGMIGNDAAIKAPADGHTILLGITALVQAPALYSKLPYDVQKDLKPLTVVARSADLLLVHKDVPANSLKELLALARAEPSKYALGTYGNGTSSHIHAAMLNQQAKLDLTLVPYKGAAPLMTDLLGGHVNVAFVDSTSAQSHLSSGRVKTLAVTGARQSPLAPDAPTLTSLGYHSFEPYGWFGLFTQAKTPDDVATKLADALIEILKLPAVRTRIAELGVMPGGDSMADFTKEMHNDLNIWGKVIREANIRLD